MSQSRITVLVLAIMIGAAVVAWQLGRERSSRVSQKDAAEIASPLMQQALRMEDSGQIEAAIALYVKALDVDPAAARPHLHLAFLLHDAERDYVGAIYHYQRYLAMRRASEKAEMIQRKVEEARQAFAAEIYGRPPDLVQEVASLRQENGLLEAEVSRLGRELTQAQRALAEQARLARRPVPTTTTTTQPAPTARPRLAIRYKVQPGDNLSRIAERFYGDRNLYVHILRANRRALRGGDTIRPGQVIEIPPIPEG